MKLFARRQTDPLSARTQALSKEIARLEAEIAVLAEKKPAKDSKPATVQPPADTSESLPFSPAPTPSPAAIPEPPSVPLQRPPAPAAKPASHRPKRIALASIAAPEISPAGVRQPAPPTAPPAPNDPHLNDLGVRKYDLLSAWRRLTHHLSGPTSNNPKMVHYLAAGSIQGLRPLRYERRVARNRFLAFLSLLLLVLWGLAYWSFKR